MNDKPFILGQIYRRTIIQDQYGGNRQGGIANCASHPYIFIFSGDAGHQHGYKDQWENDNIFSYTGEGQLNNMSFIRGNLALRDHVNNGKRVFLFIYVASGFVRFESELELLDIDFFQGSDREGKDRSAIKFFFKKVGKVLNYPSEQLKLSLVADGDAEHLDNTPNKTEREGLVTSRVGQGAYRKSLLFRWEFKCAVTYYSKKEILIASHIVPWKDSNDEERLDVDNGILLSPTYDALFDRHLISFENNGKIIFTDAITKSDISLIGVTGNEQIQKLTDGTKMYLEKHRQLIV